MQRRLNFKWRTKPPERILKMDNKNNNKIEKLTKELLNNIADLKREVKGFTNEFNQMIKKISDNENDNNEQLN